MYPHVSGCPSPNYIYSGYEHYYSKDSWASVPPSSWPTFYSRSSSLAETAVNPKMTILPPQPILVSDIDTPSSVSSHSVLTPSSPFPHHDVGEAEFQSMEFDEVDFEDDDEYIDSDFADEMEGIIDEAPSPLYGASAPQVIKSTSALAGALGDVPSSSYDSDRGMLVPADRRLSASVPGYPSASHRSAASQQRWPEKVHSSTLQTSRSPHDPDSVYPLQHTYTQRNYMSSLLAPNSPSMYNVSSSSSLAGAITPSAPSLSHVRHTSLPLPILQPQPIRPIPPIPIADLASSADEEGTRCSPAPPADSHPSQTLSPLPLLCQPVSDAVLYQLKERSASNGSSSAMDDAKVCYDQPEDEPESGSLARDDLIVTADNDDRFAPPGVAFCQERHPHTSAGAACSMAEKLYSCGMGLPIRWQ